MSDEELSKEDKTALTVNALRTILVTEYQTDLAILATTNEDEKKKLNVRLNDLRFAKEQLQERLKDLKNG